MARLSDLSVLVTGVDRPLGGTIARRLVAEGAIVLSTVAPGGTSVVADLPVDPQPLDVTDPDDWQRIASGLIAEDRPLHGLVNSAASVRTGPLAEMDPADLQTMVDVNMLGPALGIRTLAPLLAKSGGGSIVNVASTEAMRGARHAAVFSATNWGLRGLTRSVALELGASGIRVNTVCPSIGLMQPASLDTAPAPALADGSRPREVTHGDVAAMVAFLLSDDSATCTGGDFLVDAGSAA